MKHGHHWLIIFNLIGAVVMAIAAASPIMARRAKAYATYREFQSHRLLVEHPDYDVERALRALAGDNHLEVFGFSFASAVCLTNAMVVYVLLRRTKT